MRVRDLTEVRDLALDAGEVLEVGGRSEEEAGALLSDDVLARFAFAGTPAEVAGQAEALFDAGASRIDFGTPHGIDEPHGVVLLCAEVLPRLRLA